MKRAVIYVRVSDSRQVENTSLASQEEICRQWCQSRGIEVERVFTDAGESAKTADRTEFQRMFAYLRRMRGSITHVVVYKLDRFSRTLADTSLYGTQLRLLGIELQSATEVISNTPSGRLMEGVLAVINQFDNETRGERALNGMKSRVASGRWCWPAPIGYLSGRAKNLPSLVLDPERAPLIAKLFELIASRQFQPSEALSTVTALGLRTNKGEKIGAESFAHLLRNPVYHGIVESKKWGISVRGDFEPIVSPELFDQVQQVLAGKAAITAPRPANRDDFPLRGTVLCTICNLPLTAAFSTGKSGKPYGYYRCFRSGGHTNVRIERLEQDFVALLERLQPRNDRMTLIDRIFERVWRQKQGTRSDEVTTLRTQLERLETRKTNVLAQMAAGNLAEDDFRSLYASIRSELEEVRGRLRSAESSELDLETALEYLKFQFWNTHILWQQSDLAGKVRLQRAIFPNGVVWSSEGFGTPVTHSIFSLLAAAESEESVLVGPEGFEPPTKGL
jgi:site-specific DNA recombinase